MRSGNYTITVGNVKICIMLKLIINSYNFETKNGIEILPSGVEGKDLGVYFLTNLHFDKHINEAALVT